MRAALFFVVLLALPVVAASVSLPVASRMSGYLVPQASCSIVFDRAEAEQCVVYAPVSAVNELRLRMVGEGVVFAIVGDASSPQQWRYLDCARSCVATFSLSSAATAELFVSAVGVKGTSVSVAVQRGFGGELL